MTDYYDCADYPKLTRKQELQGRPQHRECISNVLHRPDVLRDSTPLPEPSTACTVPQAHVKQYRRRGTAWVLGLYHEVALVSTLPICFREGTNHDSGGTTLAVCETTRRRIDRQCFSLRRSLAHLTPPKRASPHRPDVLREKPLACPLRERPLRGAPGYFEAYGTAPLRSGTDPIFTGLVMYFSTHAANGPVQPRCGAQRTNVGCNPVLARFNALLHSFLSSIHSIREHLWRARRT